MSCYATISPAQEWSSGPILCAKNGPPRTTFGYQKWSPLANSGPSMSQNWSGGLFLAIKRGPPDQFVLPHSLLLSSKVFAFLTVGEEVNEKSNV